jgi:ankyrin repeat protein
VLFSDGTFAYYKSKGRKKIQGCIQLNDGVVSVQHVDVRKSDKAYVFQVEKGFYKLICYCCSQFEAELWVTALRAVRRAEPPCFEIDLTPQEEKAGSNAVSRHLNKIFIADKHIADRVAEFKSSEFDHSFVSIQNFIVELDDIVIDRYHLEFYQDEAIEMLPGNDLVRLIRRNVEDRIFLPLYSAAYASLETYYLRVARGRTLKNLKVFKSKAQEYFGVPADLAHVYDWMDIVMMINTLDCVSLPTHKLEIIVAAGKLIAETIARSNGKFFELADETLAAIFRYVVSRSSLDDLPILRALLKTCYVYHPACQNNTNVVEAFLDAIKWIEGFEVGGGGEDADRLDPWTIAASRVSVTISTNDVGIQLTTDGNGRGAIVYNIRKQSQAALSASIVPGLALIAINQESVVLMPFSDVVRKLRTAPLPKRLTFMTEFYYYQLLSLDAEMFQYLTCLAASRGDSDSLAWMRGWCHVDLNQICSWEKARGKQIFGFEPTSGKGTPLHAAAHNGQSVMVKHLLGMGADPNICNRKLKRPLHVVKQSLDMALIIQLLVDSGADIDAPQQKGLTPLMSMCVRGSLEGAATLLALGANIHRVAWSNGFSALEFAVYGGFVDIVELCLSKGADPNGATLEGETSLHLAASTGHSDMLMCLLQNGANPNARNRFGQTPLGVLLNAAPQLDRETVTFCVDVLVSSGCRLDTRDIFGRQASHDMMILGNESIASAVSELTHESSIDIFGCCPDDYSQPALNESDLHDIAGAKAANFWRVGGAKSSVSPRSVEEVIEAIVGTGTLDLADLMAFVLFLDSFSSMNEVLECVNNHVKHRQNGTSNG